MTVLDDYQVHSYGLDEHNCVEQVAIKRRDGAPVTSLADVQAVADEHAPDALLLFVHLWLAHPATHEGGEEPAGQGERAAAAEITLPPSASITAPPSRRRRRGGGTLNLRDREIAALAELIDDHVHLDDESERADSLRAVRLKLARLPQAVTA